MTKELNKPIFIISLDTELLWGYIAYPSHDVISLMKADKEKVRGCIDTLLNLFEKHNIPATWAIVGHLFLDHCECEGGIPHKEMPRFKDDWYSADPCTDIQRDPLYYGRDIYLRYTSVVNGKLMDLRYQWHNVTEYEGKFGDNNKIYNNGGSEVWK